MALPALVQQIARRFREQVEAACGAHVLDMRVFGSMARGDFDDRSDLDIFVLVDENTLPVKNAISVAAWRVGYEMELSTPISPLIMSRAHFEELRRRERRIARDILSEGVPI